MVTTTTAPLETTTTVAAVDEEAAIIEAYLGYWEAFFTVTNPGQPDHPIIDETTVGVANDFLVRVATERLAEGTVYEFPEGSVAGHDPIVVRVDGDTAVVGDCFIDDSRRRNLTTGSVDGDSVASKLIESGLVRGADGEWRVARGTALERWEGVAGCAID